MVRSKGVTISVKVPINWDAMTVRTRQRIRQTVGRDTRVIHAFLGIIEQHENELLTGKNRDRIDASKLDQLTITALQVKTGQDQRLSVPHDFKGRFPRISSCELIECRLTAVASYESFLKLHRKKGRKASRPISVNGTRRIPRWVFSRRFKLHEKKTSSSRWWLDICDALDTVREGKYRHDRLTIPLKISLFHLNQVRRGEVKSLQLFIDRKRKWWVTLAVRIGITIVSESSLPVAILGIDLGIKKAACSTLLTPDKTRDTRYFVQKEKVKTIKKYDRLVDDLQREMHTRRNNGYEFDEVSRKLRQMRSKRENVAREYDRALIRQLLDYISELSKKYKLYVSIGRLKNIRVLAKRGNYQGRRFRSMIHSWAFARITDSLKHGLAQLGWKVDGKDPMFRVVPENWTSIICWKCGSKGRRPRQNYFYCPSCGQKVNADRNGSINIAARILTLTKSLHDVRGLGLWTRAVVRGTTNRRARPKARKKNPSSKGKSLLSKKRTQSSPGESAAVHFAQSSLSDFGDKIEKSDNDPAVGRTVETLSVAGNDTPALTQEEEARTVGGIPSR